MTFYVENETDKEFPFSVQDIVEKVAEAVLDMENCPYEVCINVLLTDNEGIRDCNREYRQIDKETDVLSFPAVTFQQAGDFSIAEGAEADCFDLTSGELILGDIMISVDRIVAQAEAYGHSQLREFAFLVAHSMFHLCGYDHMTEKEAALMNQKQEAVLQQLNITRASS